MMIVKMTNMVLSALISGPCVVKNDFDVVCNFCIAVMTALAKSWDLIRIVMNVIVEYS